MKRENDQIEDKEDMEIIRAYERGEFVPVRNQKKFRKIARQAAVNHLKKDSRINIRMSGATLDKLKRVAADEGLPYQTYIASLLYKIANGRMINK